MEYYYCIYRAIRRTGYEILLNALYHLRDLFFSTEVLFTMLPMTIESRLKSTVNFTSDGRLQIQ